MRHARVAAAAWCLGLGLAAMHCGSPSGADAGVDAGTSGGGGGSNTGGGLSSGGGAPSGGGGAATGGGAAGGGGSGGGGGVPVPRCALAPPFSAGDLAQVGYFPARSTVPQFNAAYFSMPSNTANKFDTLGLEFYYRTSPSLPLVEVIAPENYQTCTTCFRLSLACDLAQNCASDYLAQSGSVTITAATPNVDAGAFALSLTDVVFEQWNFAGTPDFAVPDGGCFVLPSLMLDARWP